ncbi:hypothetical protein THOM_0943 [Trachipleistophora hominis]|uniref:Uncharacterized protein n=1 Tax=Trachipleistophora hominis TaxID=72359 RepID=L7JXN0_TRAHO|nr:hypothetical protein THOM_0943 [Trachipleistophora hominis]
MMDGYNYISQKIGGTYTYLRSISADAYDYTMDKISKGYNVVRNGGTNVFQRITDWWKSYGIGADGSKLGFFGSLWNFIKSIYNWFFGGPGNSNDNSNPLLKQDVNNNSLTDQPAQKPEICDDKKDPTSADNMTPDETYLMSRNAKRIHEWNAYAIRKPYLNKMDVIVPYEEKGGNGSPPGTNGITGKDNTDNPEKYDQNLKKYLSVLTVGFMIFMSGLFVYSYFRESFHYILALI